MCLAVGQNPALQLPVNFTVINATLAYALEDVVLQPLERDGVDFWWIDWQQGESQGGAHGKKQNPTIWLAHLRSNNAHRRSQNVRNMVLARWGGMGAHRYPVHFSGDATITWTELAFQPYFSMVRSNILYRIFCLRFPQHLCHEILPHSVPVAVVFSVCVVSSLLSYYIDGNQCWRNLVS